MDAIGPAESKVDAKGRALLPAVHRRQIPLDTELRLVEAFDGRTAILLCEKTYLSGLVESVRLAHTGDPAKGARIAGIIAGRGLPIQIDNQNRILLPQKMRERAAISSDVLFVGTGEIIEIWNPGTYEDWEKRQIATNLEAFERFYIGSRIPKPEDGTANGGIPSSDAGAGE